LLGDPALDRVVIDPGLWRAKAFRDHAGDGFL
jgi:hypothetical protein